MERPYNKYLRHPIRLIEQVFPSILCRTQSTSIHLTFDDGPHPTATVDVLNILKEFNIHATFFLVGKHVQQYPDIVLRIADEKHIIGNHTFNHPNLFWRSKEDTYSEIHRTNEAISTITNSIPLFFRPPYGYFRPSTLLIATTLQMKTVLWTRDTKDFLIGSEPPNTFYILNTIHPGNIVLLHDNEMTVNSVSSSLRFILEELSRRNFSFAPLRV